jgi:hypothetical protein
MKQFGKRTQHARTGARVGVSAAALIAMMLLPDPHHLLRERHFFMSEIAAAGENPKPARESTTPPARNPDIAVEEEYRIALQQATSQALALFIARHPGHPLAEKARADLKRLPR